MPMEDHTARPSAGGQHEELVENAVKAQPHRNRAIRGGYLTAALLLIALYPFLPELGRDIVLLVASLGAIPGVLVARHRAGPGGRRPWELVLAALAFVSAANLFALFPGESAASLGRVVDAIGNVFVLAAALVVVMRQGRDRLGSVIDTTIAALAVGGVLWEVLLAPNLIPEYRTGPTKMALCVVVFALCGVLGALAQLVIMRPVAALRLLITALVLALFAYTIPATMTNPQANTAAGMMLVGVYTAVGLVGLDPSAAELLHPAHARPDRLSIRRLVLLALAITIVPIVVGVRQLAGATDGGLALIISSATITPLVLLRIGQLSTQRDQAVLALEHAATHDALTGLLNRKEFVTRFSEALERGERCAVLFCDLDRFKAVNDRFGHANGDRLLIEAGRRLRDSVRAQDLVSRFGGDEFVVLFQDATLNEVHAINERIIDALSRPVPMPDGFVTVGASTGIALATGELDPEELIARADHAMYEAKTSRP
jgi:diguanylate cyclase (GGDEF)-like protein